MIGYMNIIINIVGVPKVSKVNPLGMGLTPRLSIRDS